MSTLAAVFKSIIYIGAVVMVLGLMNKFGGGERMVSTHTSAPMPREVMSTQTRKIDRPSFEATNISKVGLFMRRFGLLIVVGFWSRMI